MCVSMSMQVFWGVLGNYVDLQHVLELLEDGIEPYNQKHASTVIFRDIAVFHSVYRLEYARIPNVEPRCRPW